MNTQKNMPIFEDESNVNDDQNVLSAVNKAFNIFVRNMARFFKRSKKNKKESTTVPDAMLKLQEIEALLQKKQEFLESKIYSEIVMARSYAKTNRALAFQALKRKKRYEAYLQKIDGTLTTIEMQRETLETTHTDKMVVESMRVAADALKTAHKKLDVEEVHTIMDDLADERDKSQEISDAISKPVGFGLEDVDEDELMKELEELEQEEINAQLLSVQLPSTSNQVPLAGPSFALLAKRKSKKEKINIDDEEEELAEMGQWAS